MLHSFFFFQNPMVDFFFSILRSYSFVHISRRWWWWWWNHKKFIFFCVFWKRIFRPREHTIIKYEKKKMNANWNWWRGNLLPTKILLQFFEKQKKMCNNIETIKKSERVDFWWLRYVTFVHLICKIWARTFSCRRRYSVTTIWGDWNFEGFFASQFICINNIWFCFFNFSFLIRLFFFFK